MNQCFKLAPLSFVLFPLYLIASWLVTLLAWLLSPLVAAISVITGKNNVGGPLSYLYTHNASLDGGVDQGVDGYEAGATGFKLWWQRVCWVCRNPAYKFNAHILGFRGEGATLIYERGFKTAPYGYWSVIKSPGGMNYFGYRGKRVWFGWNYRTYGGYHQLKSKPWDF